MIDLRHGDCLEVMRDIPDGSVDLVLCDPPYNIGVKSEVGGKEISHDWDKIDNYLEWSLAWLQEAERVLKPNGVFYFFHSEIGTIAELLHLIKERTAFSLRSFCVWDKGRSYRVNAWDNGGGNVTLRSWFNICEYCLHFFKTDGGDGTGLSMILDNPECFKPLKDWYKAEMRRLNLTAKDIGRKYTEVTGRKPYMLRHYFCDSQFEIPTREIWDSVYVPLGFRKGHEALRDEYEALRPYHAADKDHCNVWRVNSVANGADRLHVCQKPVSMLERIVRVSSRPGEVVLDCFMGSGSTGVACVNTGRSFIGIEKDAHYFEIARKRIEDAERERKGSQFDMDALDAETERRERESWLFEEEE